MESPSAGSRCPTWRWDNMGTVEPDLGPSRRSIVSDVENTFRVSIPSIETAIIASAFDNSPRPRNVAAKDKAKRRQRNKAARRARRARR